MKREEIKTIKINFYDTDFVRVFDWIGKICLFTILEDTNVCWGKLLEDTVDIEDFVHSLLPTAIEFIQYKEDKYSEFVRYEEISKDELTRLVKEFAPLEFLYNEIDDSSDGESVVIDILNKTAYIK